LNKKKKKNGDFLEKLGFEFCGKKWGIKGILVAGSGYGWWRRPGGGVSVVGEVMDGGRLGFGGVWEERSGGEGVRLLGKNGGEGEKV
jgi:hypothetical protein